MQSPKPYREQRPWGEFVEFTHNAPSTVKLITVNAGESFSLQTHERRDEFWHIISGKGTVQIGDNRAPIREGDEYFIPRATKHRVEASTSNVVILEIAFGQSDEKDITRFEDKYNRAT